jgi:hypothetical protein
MRCNSWTLLVVALLADAGPAPNCDRNRESDGFLWIEASNCACVSGPIWVSVDGSQYRLSCGRPNALDLRLPAGAYRVSAVDQKASWPERACSVTSGVTTRVDLGCPSDGARGCGS